MTSAAHEGRGYLLRLVVLFAFALMLALIWLVLPLERGTVWTLTVACTLAACAMLAWRTRQLANKRTQNAQVLAALGTATSAIPDGMHTGMPLVLLIGDGLPELFNRDDTTRLAWVGDGAIWLRVDEPNALPRLAAAVKQWRNGRAPDGVVLSIAPALHANADALAQKLRLVRQAMADASRMLGTRLPGYVAVYQRLTGRGPIALSTQDHATDGPQWYGVASPTPLSGASAFEPAIRAAEDTVQETSCIRDAVARTTRAAGIASIVDWTQRVVMGVLLDRQQPAAPWPLHGAGWIDCGPASSPDSPWEREIELRTKVAPAPVAASPSPWPLPQPLIETMPVQRRTSPGLAALGHALALLACAAAVAFWGSAKNNEALLTKIGADLERFNTIPAANDAAKRDALVPLVAARDQLDRYARTGVPLRLSFGMYHGAELIVPLNRAIASYVPPAPPPAVVTLDSMSLFDSGKGQLKEGSTRAMVGALQMIKAHPGKRILVAGHTDNVGDPPSNLKLSVARAAAVRDWLVDASGISTTQFAIQGYGDTRPIADNGTQEGRARNRRVEITLVPDAVQ
ncbi:OmpA-OmpF porin, OOP family [Paraburkholderia sacchari]